nr:MAG TPA: hypothetical protein [Caudoviricetes sp.]
MILHIHIYCKSLFIFFFKIFVPRQFPPRRVGARIPPPPVRMRDNSNKPERLY